MHGRNRGEQDMAGAKSLAKLCRQLTQMLEPLTVAGAPGDVVDPDRHQYHIKAVVRHLSQRRQHITGGASGFSFQRPVQPELLAEPRGQAPGQGLVLALHPTPAAAESPESVI